MLELSLLEKIKTVLNLISTVPYFMLLLVFAVVVYFLLFQSTKQSIRNKKFIYTSTYILIILALIIKYHSGILTLLDNLVDNFVMIFYFPNIAAYILMIITINIVLMISLLSDKINDNLKKLNIAIYCVMTYLLFLSLDIISKNSLNIFLDTSLYSNQNLMAIIQLNNIIFIAWMIAIVLFKLSDKLSLPKTRVERTEILPRKDYYVKSKLRPLPSSFIAREIKPRVIYQTRTEKEPDIFTKEEYLLVLQMLKKLKDK